MSIDVPEVLFVCVHNAGRSQMAAGLTRLRSQGRIRVRSAGSAPAEEINPNAVAVLEELGIDITDEFPKPLTDGGVRTGPGDSAEDPRRDRRAGSGAGRPAVRREPAF